MSTDTVWLLSAEIVLIAVAVLIYLGGAFVDARRCWSWIAAGGIVVAGVALWDFGRPDTPGGPPAPAAAEAGSSSPSDAAETPRGPVTSDPLAYYARWLSLAVGALFVLLTSRPLATQGTPEYVGSLLLAVAGLMLVCSASELVLLFVGLELISIPTYILLCLGRRGAPSEESAAKYFFLSVFASAMLLYGFSFLYGTTGSTDLSVIHQRLSAAGGLPSSLEALAKVALVLVFVGLGFKIAAVPFHFYAPDVYQGTTYPNAGLLSVVPKAAGMVALVRILVAAMPGLQPYAWRIALVLSVLTMTFGNVMALWQDNLRRLLAYSSVAHAGYMLIGLSVGLATAGVQSEWDGISALFFYLAVYAVATIGMFAAMEFLGRRDRQIEAVDELAGLGRTRPLLAVAVAVFMFSLAGIPPMAGFWGKLVVFGSALSVDARNWATGDLWPWFVALAVIGVLNAAVAAAYYLRIVGVMYFRTPLGTPRPRGGLGPWLAMTACALLTVLIGILPGPLLRESDNARPGAVADTPARQRSLAADLAAEDSASAGRTPGF